MRILVDSKKLALALQRLEFLYWHLRRNGGPDLDVQQIQKLLADAMLEHTEEDDEFAVLDAEPPVSAV